MNSSVCLLLIGEAGSQIGAARDLITRRGYRLMSVESIDDALLLLRQGSGLDLAIIDIDLDVVGLLHQLKTERMRLPVLACGPEKAEISKIRSVVAAGAVDFIELPPDPEAVVDIIEVLIRRQDQLVATDPRMMQLIATADRVASTGASVLITGETGVGKEVVARYLHLHSSRSRNRFVAVNCAAIPDTLLESELFGHEKGAFSGAIARRIGKFEEASGGTLLLDEISEMDLRLQAKLLRVIQEREIDRLGGARPVPVDIRILATSNRDLSEAVAAGSFREDLYYRLNVIRLDIPPLRERVEDIPLLAHHFLAHYAQMNGMDCPVWDEGAVDILRNHAWPGNVRELENLCHRLLLLCDGERIGSSDVIYNVRLASASGEGALDENEQTDAASGMQVPFVGRSVEDVERELVLGTLAHYKDTTLAATILGISIRSLRDKLRRYGDDSSGVSDGAFSEQTRLHESKE